MAKVFFKIPAEFHSSGTVRDLHPIPFSFPPRHGERKTKSGANITVNPEKQEKPQIDWEHILADVGVGTTVKHKLFGEGIISKMDKAKKYIHVKFKKGEKQFVFPDAFIGGFLSLQ